MNVQTYFLYVVCFSEWSKFPHIVDSSPLSYMYFRIIFSHFVACLVNVLRVSFKEQKLLILQVQSIDFSFIVCAFLTCLRNLLPNQR